MNFDNKEITERLFKITEALEIKDVGLAKEIGVSRHNIPKYRNNSLAIPAWRVINFIKLHREINTDWLLFGDGEMFIKPGIHKMTMTDKGEIHFSTEIEDKNSLIKEIKSLKAILSEKEMHNTSLQETIYKQSGYIEKLIEKL